MRFRVAVDFRVTRACEFPEFNFAVGVVAADAERNADRNRDYDVDVDARDGDGFTLETRGEHRARCVEGASGCTPGDGGGVR